MLHELLDRAPKAIKDAADQSDMRIVCQSSDDDWAEMLVVDMVGDDFGQGVTANKAIDFLNANRDKKVMLRINSPGGLAFEGLQIYNALSQHSPDVLARIEGNAFSAASMIAMAADRIEIFENSTIGIHRAAGFTFGNRDDHANTIEWLDSLDNALIGIYTDRTGQDRSLIEEMIRGEVDGTLMDAKQAKSLGFVDEIIGNKKRKDESKSSTEKRCLSVAMAENRNRLARMRSESL